MKEPPHPRHPRNPRFPSSRDSTAPRSTSEPGGFGSALTGRNAGRKACAAVEGRRWALEREARDKKKPRMTRMDADERTSPSASSAQSAVPFFPRFNRASEHLRAGRLWLRSHRQECLCDFPEKIGPWKRAGEDDE